MQETVMERLRGAAARFWRETVMGDGSDVGSRPAPVDGADDVTRLYGLHSILKYDQYDPENGLFYNDTSVGFCFEVIAQVVNTLEKTTQFDVDNAVDGLKI